jgi:hypothetical protein
MRSYGERWLGGECSAAADERQAPVPAAAA